MNGVKNWCKKKNKRLLFKKYIVAYYITFLRKTIVCFLYTILYQLIHFIILCIKVKLLNILRYRYKINSLRDIL